MDEGEEEEKRRKLQLARATRLGGVNSCASSQGRVTVGINRESANQRVIVR